MFLLLLLFLQQYSVEGLKGLPGPELNEECLIPLWLHWLEVTVAPWDSV